MICLRRIAACAALTACAPEPLRPTYQFDALYPDAAATPAAIRRDVEAYAARICGGGAEILDRQFVSVDGPRYVRIRFGCP